jgi:hypothetical protein
VHFVVGSSWHKNFTQIKKVIFAFYNHPITAQGEREQSPAGVFSPGKCQGAYSIIKEKEIISPHEHGIMYCLGVIQGNFKPRHYQITATVEGELSLQKHQGLHRMIRLTV